MGRLGQASGWACDGRAVAQAMPAARASRCRREWVPSRRMAMSPFVYRECPGAVARWACGTLAMTSSTPKFFAMTARTSNSNVRSADVSRAAPTAVSGDDDAGSRTLRRGLQLLDAVLAGGRDGV